MPFDVHADCSNGVWPLGALVCDAIDVPTQDWCVPVCACVCLCVCAWLRVSACLCVAACVCAQHKRHTRPPNICANRLAAVDARRSGDTDAKTAGGVQQLSASAQPLTCQHMHVHVQRQQTHTYTCAHVCSVIDPLLFPV